MTQNNITILSTRPLPMALADAAARKGIRIENDSFIRIEPIESVEVQQEIEQALLRSVVVIFTSQNAVEAVAEFMGAAIPDWMIYCTGHATRQTVLKYFDEALIAGSADNAALLAELVAGAIDNDEIIFFCGDQRRDELPRILNDNGLELVEIMVYQTIKTPHRIKKHYNGILFFSPTAVESFFAANRPDPAIMHFAIGDTTAAAIRTFAPLQVLTSKEPVQSALVEKAIDYFIQHER